MEQDGAHRVLSAANGTVPGGFRKKEKRGQKEGQDPALINSLQKAAGRLAGSLCTEWFIDFL